MKRQDQIIGFLIPVLVFSAYLRSLRPGLWWYDSSQLAASGICLGISHPPGHPLHALTSHVLSFLNLGDVWFRSNLCSALAGALLAFLIWRVLMEVGTRERSMLGSGTARSLRILGAPLGALLFSFSRIEWMRSTTTEVNVLNILFMTIVLVFFTKLLAGYSHRWYSAILMMLGLATMDHGTGILGIFLVLFWAVCRPWMSERGGWAQGWISEFGQWLESGIKVVGLVILLFLYVPIRAQRSPDLMWGHPDRLSSWWETINLSEYRGRMSEPTTPLKAFYRLQRYVSWYPEEMGALPFVISLGGLIWMARRFLRRRGPAGAAWALLAFQIPLGLIGLTLAPIFPLLDTHPDHRADVLPGFWQACLFAGVGIAWLVGHSPSRPKRRVMACVTLLIPLPVWGSVSLLNWGRSDYACERYIREGFSQVDRDGIYVADSDNDSFPHISSAAISGFRCDLSVAAKKLSRWGHPERDRGLRDVDLGGPDAMEILARRGLASSLFFQVGSMPSSLRSHASHRGLIESLMSFPVDGSGEAQRRETAAWFSRVVSMSREMSKEERERYAFALVNLVNAWRAQREDVAQDLEALQLACFLKPDHAEVRSLLATAYAGMGQGALAEAHFEAAMALEPWNATPCVNYGVWLREVGRPRDAVHCFAKAHRLSQKPSRAGLELGLTYLEMGQTQRGMTWLSRSARENGSVEEQQDLAYGFLEAGKPEEAKKILMKLVTQKPSDVDVRILLARALEDCNDLQAAEQEHRWLIQNGPHKARHCLDLGWCLARQERWGEAAERWGACLCLDPDPETRMRATSNLQQLGEVCADLPGEEARQAIVLSGEILKDPQRWCENRVRE